MANQHNSVVISRDGRIIAGGHDAASFAGSGIIYPPATGAGGRTGAVSIFERKASGWSLRRIMEPVVDTKQWFGHAVGVGNNGRALIVGAFQDSSAASGIGGDPYDTSVPLRGAAWLY